MCSVLCVEVQQSVPFLYLVCLGDYIQAIIPHQAFDTRCACAQDWYPVISGFHTPVEICGCQKQ